MPNISLRLPADRSGRITAAMCTALAIVVLTAAVLGWGVARADDEKITGNAVSDVQLSAILRAAHSCPMLGSHRIAGQLMAESGFDATATGTASGGSGLAGLKDADWKKWAPWPGAPRTDTTAGALALAHRMCGLSGELRQAGVQGDPWRLSLAAYHSGLDAVTEAGGVPEAAQLYVDESAGYAAYYADLPQFGGAGAVEVVDAVVGDTPEAQPLPDAYVGLVAEAGRICPEVTPAAVAAELMAASAFDEGKLGEAGRQGVAQFRSDVWSRYAPPGASAWEPGSAIPALGRVLCALTDELDGLEGDPYAAALAAFHAGPDTVRRAGGLPDVMTRAFLKKVTDYTDYYRLDSRLGAPVAPSPVAGSPSASASPSAKATPSATPSPTPGTPAQAGAPAPVAPAPQGTTAAPKPPVLPGQQITHWKTGKCVDAGAATDGVIMTVTDCNPTSRTAQRWDVRSDGTIRSYLTGLCLDVAWAKVENNVKVQTANCNGTAAQQWTIADNTLYTGLDSNYCLDVNQSEAGLPVVIWWCVHHDKQSWTVKK
ncbi:MULTISPECIES: RICIN domain-containing protein [Catenuloplanes]|uniref:Ricin B lectin domain-containing protein n=1 Tax=Catenuloplanes niger TaxID=587534 RepID=A0AAE3ZLZ2_9ACTN|nr:RICIN domain-containing protein [Catenuloplanes niger]MDR7321065.1 hypothetical protein [Catenuloplanes niger]